MSWQGVLVSVRDAPEAEEALAGGAAVIDVKDPARGSLGAAEPAAVAAVAGAVGRRAPWTMAAGELAAGVVPLAKWIEAVCGRVPTGAAEPAAVKVGLAGMADRPWRDELLRFHAVLPAGCMHVAVAYADYDRVDAPPPSDVIATAARVGCGMLLIDTADKGGAGLPGLWSPDVIAGWMAAARRHGLGVALAGRISIPEIPLAVRLGADLVALRSAVCSNAVGGDVRLGCVSSALVAAAVTEYETARLTSSKKQS
ncbi:MAG: (5-formylfuran-3-yl)methyl phosphate synthase [Planctomycetia bacterium]